MTSIVHIASSEPMTSIDQQHMSLGSSATSPTSNPHYKKDLVSNSAKWEAQISISDYQFTPINKLYRSDKE